MPAPKNSPFRPTHLSIFVSDPGTGAPGGRLPLYAEVAITQPTQPVEFDERLLKVLRSVLVALDPTIAGPVLAGVEKAMQEAFGEVVDPVSRGVLASDFAKAQKFFEQALKDVLTTSGQARFSDIKAADLKPLIAAALKRAAKDFDIVTVDISNDPPLIWANPLGVLTTDHVGYVSFDLKRLRSDVYEMLAAALEARRSNPAAAPTLAIWVYPYGDPGRFDAFAQGRFASDAIVARLSIKASPLPPALQNMGPRALQNPSLTDWLLSPASFAASPKTLVGEDGCEQLVPATVALQEFVLRQVVRLSDAPPGWNIPEQHKAAYVDEYKVSWFSLGHSLGEILYSLPLAPGESVKLAVIDWSWDSLTSRDEKTTLTEDVLHQTHRDRTISETVKAGLKEYQHGSSFMGGMAHSSGATGSANLGIVGLGAAVGNAWSLGGSTASSDGSRDLAAENVQRLSDSFSQASSSQREINSTVVIHARQEEKESIQTRTFTNYNHSHTLTILYYEVLRHYRVTVEWIRRRPAVLVNLPTRIEKFDEATLISRRWVLEATLLDPALKPAFDILEKQESIREHQTLNGIAASDAWTPQFWEGEIEFALFEIGIKTSGGGDDTTTDQVMVNLILVDGTTESRPLMHLWEKGGETNNINTGKRLEDDSSMAWFIAKTKGPAIKWRHLQGFEFVLHDTDAWRMERLAINGFHAGGPISLFADSPVNYYFLHNGSSNTCTLIKRPGAVPPALPPSNRSPEKSLTPEERHQVNKLLVHFEANKDYYNRIVLLATDSTSIAIQFEAAGWLADNADPNPLEVFGSYVAYPLARRVGAVDDTVVVDIAAALNGNDVARRQWALDRLATMSEADRQTVIERLPLAAAKSERLITLPTRGVFAEGKLGHCNVSEEIDDTRFWKWEEHRIPFEAPGINPITAVTPQPQPATVAPTPFPQSLVNIVSPTAAPDPTGLAAALTLLGTPNIFRDMSGQAAVADLLKKLSDNTISIADAANRARQITGGSGGGGPSGGGTGGGTGSGGTGGTGSGTTRAATASGGNLSPQSLSDLHQLGNVLKQGVDSGYIDTNQASDIYRANAANLSGMDLQNVSTGGQGSGGSATPQQSTDQFLAEAARVEFFDTTDIDNYFTDLTGLPFISWFSANVAGRGTWGSLAIGGDQTTRDRFTQIWNQIEPMLGAASVRLTQFASLMAVFVNETGGTFSRGAERVGGYGHPDLSYAFDSFLITDHSGRSFTKASYNAVPNRSAFVLFHDPVYLAAHGALQPTAQPTRDLPAWKGTTWPVGVPTTLDRAQTGFIQEADFYKFRGRGFIQNTWRSAYEAIIDSVKTYTGTQAVVLSFKAVWAAVPTADAATSSSNSDWDQLFQDSEMVIPMIAIRTHDQGHGNYLALSDQPSQLKATGLGSFAGVGTRISGDPNYGLILRNRVLELLGALERSSSSMSTRVQPGGTINL